MSSSRVNRIHCDNTRVGVPYMECPDKIRTVNAGSLPGARRLLKKQGWTYRELLTSGGDIIHVDLCPYCDKHGRRVTPKIEGRGRPRKAQTDG